MMKKSLRYGQAAALTALVLAFAACKSAPESKPVVTNQGESTPPRAENNIEVAPIRSTVMDWQDRNMGEATFPAWLKQLVVNNRQSVVIQEFSLTGNPVIRVSQAERTNREEARVLADLMFAQAIANELKRYVVTAAASRLDQGQMDIVEEITSSTKVTLTGAQKVKDFWQLIEKEDGGLKTRTNVWYIVYSFPGDTWAQLTRKYVNDVIGQLPNSPVQQQIANAFGEIDAEARRNQERSDAEFKQQIEMQRKAADNEHQRQMMTTALTADVAKTQATAQANAKYEAYKSKDPLAIAAASVTGGDIDWISALSTAASIVF